ncbi:hypothetical protein [Candidatus Borrarchaeum sp.]|uniref:hypothetical protein n=1 Tax=Candidatus Borrarchaeum sp. TaxID=2846742 RepID=UPI00257DF775|nr:hypothetical protein [Candidatus Borrarchaeum sp.]
MREEDKLVLETLQRLCASNAILLRMSNRMWSEEHGNAYSDGTMSVKLLESQKKIDRFLKKNRIKKKRKEDV